MLKLRQKIIALFAFVFLCPTCGFSQPEKNTDSLLKAIASQKEDAAKVSALNQLGGNYSLAADFKKATSFFLEAERLAKKINFKNGQADALTGLGRIREFEGNLAEALEDHFSALNIREQTGDTSGISYSIHYIGDIYLDLADVSDKANERRYYAEKAMEQLLKSLTLAQSINDARSMGNTLNCIGNSYREESNYTKALEYYFKAIALREETRDQQGLAVTCNNIGKAYMHLQKYPEAINYLSRSLAMAEAIGDKRTSIKAIANMGLTYLKEKKYKEALAYSLKSLSLSREISFLEYTTTANRALSEIYESPGFEQADIHKALAYYKAYVAERDSINTSRLAQAELKNEFEKKEVVAEAEKKKQQLVLWMISSGLIIVMVFAVFIFRSLKKTRQQNQVINQQKAKVESQKHLIEEKQTEIIESITYARRLQEAILPPQHFIDAHLPENFILYLPKDIVAGDFYWAEEKNGLFFIAAADSTGHGVPGAMVSVVCSNALNRSVKEFNVTETGRILDKTRELVLETFQKSASEVKDGMDISLLCIDRTNNKVSWSGANNPLWYFSNNTLHEIKADKQPIGKSDYPKPFTTHILELVPGTVFYLFTDGLPDQFGGPKGKKFKYKQFEELLTANHVNALPQQKSALETSFIAWKGDLEQVDDVCIIGVRV